MFGLIINFAFAKLLNKVNPVGGRFDLKTPEGIKEFYKEAEKVAKQYKLPTRFHLSKI